MNLLIINIAYDLDSGAIEVIPGKLGPNKNVNLKDLLIALHAAEGQYIEALEVTQVPAGEPAAVEEKSDDTADD